MTQLKAPPIPAWIEAMLPAGYVRYSLDVDSDRRMHVMETGSGFPVLMLHGNPTWGFLYRQVIAHLGPENRRCITPDLIGLGFSSKPRRMDAHTLANHAGWLGAAIDALKLDGLIFVGQDWGGPIGLRALADRAHLVKGIVILNTVVAPPRPGFKPTAFHRFANMPVVSNLAFQWGGFPQNLLHKVQGDAASISGKVADAYRYPLRKRKDRAAPLAMARMVPGHQAHPSIPDLEVCQKFIEDFKGPVEIVWGTRDPILGRALRRTRQILPDAPVTETSAGHFLQEEVPEQIAGAISRVIEKAE